ncbi:DUF536 domain-containing protein [Staphylococcus simulans]|uniref:DUF536 domain-containing protein n=1 Tax=Staphylococcus simulans TaxID=1286 RepID=UPI0030C39186
MFTSEIVHVEKSFWLKLYYKTNFATEPDNQLEMKDSQINQYSELLKNQQLLALQSNKKVEELETTLNQIENKKQEENEGQETHSDTEYERQNKADVNNRKKEKGFLSKLFSSK